MLSLVGVLLGPAEAQLAQQCDAGVVLHLPFHLRWTDQPLFAAHLLQQPVDRDGVNLQLLR